MDTLSHQDLKILIIEKGILLRVPQQGFVISSDTLSKQ
jgi:hypothetical protein